MSGSCCLYGFVGNEREHSCCFSCIHKPERLKHPWKSEFLLAERRFPAGGRMHLGRDGVWGGMRWGGMRWGGMLSQTVSPQGSLLTRYLVTGERLLETRAPSQSQPPVATAIPSRGVRRFGRAGAPARAFVGSWEQPAPGDGPCYLKPYPLIQGSRDYYEYYRAEFKDRIMCCTCKCYLIQVGRILHFFSCCGK